jgi:hypothetical protein
MLAGISKTTLYTVCSRYFGNVRHKIWSAIDILYLKLISALHKNLIKMTEKHSPKFSQWLKKQDARALKTINKADDMCIAAAHGEMDQFLKNLGNRTFHSYCDRNGLDALSYSALYQREADFKVLLHLGFNIDRIVGFSYGVHYNILDLAKLGYPENQSFQQLIEDKLKLPETLCEKMAKQFGAIIQKELQYAKAQGKKLFLLVGETHSSYKTRQLLIEFVKVAYKMGIDTLFIEDTKNDVEKAISIDVRKYVANIEHYKRFYESGIRLLGVDNHPKRLKIGIEERNKVILEEIQMHCVNGIHIGGSNHLEGLLKMENYSFAERFRKERHIVPFNFVHSEQPNSDWSRDPANVIQIYANGEFSDPCPVIDRWNECDAIPNEPAVTSDSSPSSSSFQFASPLLAFSYPGQLSSDGDSKYNDSDEVNAIKISAPTLNR